MRSLTGILQADFFVLCKSRITKSGVRASVKEVAEGPVFLRRQAARCTAGGRQFVGVKNVFHGGYYFIIDRFYVNNLFQKATRCSGNPDAVRQARTACPAFGDTVVPAHR